MGDYPGYQCVKLKSRDVYYSAKKLKNHAEGDQWVKRAQAAHHFEGNDILGKPYIEASQPSKGTEVT